MPTKCSGYNVHCAFREPGGKEEDSTCFLCRSVFSDQPKTHACLRVRGVLSVCVCVRAHRQGEGDFDHCMYVCMCGCVGGRVGCWGAARWSLHGQLRGQPLSGYPQPPFT